MNFITSRLFAIFKLTVEAFEIVLDALASKQKAYLNKQGYGTQCVKN